MRLYINLLLKVSLILIIFLSGCSFSVGPNNMLENMLKNGQPNYSRIYQETETKMYYKGKLMNIQTLKSWEELNKGTAKYELIDSEKGTFQTALSNNLIVTYRVGEITATVKKVTFPYLQNFDSKKEELIEELESLRKTHKLEFVKESTVLNEKVYEIIASPRHSFQMLGEQHLWISKKHWIILKREYLIGDNRVIVRVKDLKINPKVTVPFATQPWYIPEDTSLSYIERYAEEEITLAKIVEPIRIIKPSKSIKVEKIKRILSSDGGYLFFYTKDNKDYMQLKVMRSIPKELDVSISELTVEDQSVNIQPIPKIGIQLSWVLNDYNYELIYFDLFATKQDLERLLTEVTYYVKEDTK